jgi:histone H3/H4
MGKRIYDLVSLYGGRNPERLRTLDAATFDDLLGALRTKLNLALNKQRQSYEEEKQLLIKNPVDTAHNLYVAKSLLRRLIRTVRKMGEQAPKELTRLVEDAKELLKKSANDARTNSSKTVKGKAGEDAKLR